MAGGSASITYQHRPSSAGDAGPEEGGVGVEVTNLAIC